MGKLYIAHHLPFLLSLFVIINNLSLSTSETLRFLPNTEHKIAFFINNILENNKESSEPVLKNDNNQVPHHEDGVPYNPRSDYPDSWWPFLECMQALESGSKDDSSSMVAMKAIFASNDNLNDSLRFFGVHQKGLMESQISVIDGSGRYNGANGFAIVKSDGGKMQGTEKKLLFNVHLKYEK